MYWFAAVNDNSQMHKDMYLVALKSAILNTTLKPILIYDGEDKVFSSLVEKNATLITTRKDWVKFSPTYQQKILHLDVILDLENKTLHNPPPIAPTISSAL